MITVQKIEARLNRLDYTRPSPDREMLEGLMKDGRTRILSKSAESDLCADSDRYFEFCLSQVGSFCTASYNAVEIGLSLNIQPIYIAAAIHLYGSDWQFRFLELKRFGQLARGDYSVWKSADAWFGLGECRRRLVSVGTTSEISTGQSILRMAVRKGEMDKIREIAEAHPHRMMSILGMKRDPLYTDPRIVASKKAREKAKADAAAAGKKLAEPRSYADLTPVFNGSIAPRDVTRGFSDSSETRGTVNGRRFRV